MHGIFAFTAFDFSVASSGVMPLFGTGQAGAVTASLGWLLTPWARALVPAVLLWVMLTPVAGGVGGPGHVSKLRQLSFICRAWFFLSVPVLYVGAHVPHGAFLLGLGTDARREAYAATRAELGAPAYAAVQAAALVTILFSNLNGSGPYGGWKTAGTYTTLYSNILVERDPNHWIWPLVRLLGGPWCRLMEDLVTVTATDDPAIRSQIVIAPVVELDVFADLCASTPEWADAGRCIWMPTPPTWHCLLEYANPKVLPPSLLAHSL